MLTKVHSEFVLAIKATVIFNDDLDYCGYTNNSSHFCNTCYGIIVEKQIPKFGFVNCINVLPCQKYPDVLSDLIPVKEVFIACAHLVISVIKLKPSGTRSTASYHQICGYTIVLSQNLRPLLTILSSSNVVPHDMICIALVSKRLHTASDICFFASVQKTRVLEALRWLKTNNPLYKDIVINVDMLHTWENKFVPVGIASNVLQYEPNLSIWEGYAINLVSNNFENELHQAVNAASLDD